MAGAGIKLFRDAEVLSDEELNQYLMDQVVSVFNDEVDRDLSFGTGLSDPITNPSGDNKPVLSEGRLCYLRNRNVVQVYNGSTWQDSEQFTIEDGAVTEQKIANSAVTTDKINNLAVTEAKISNSAVTEAKIANNSVTAAKINTSGVGSGLNGGNGTALSVRTDGTTIRLSGSNSLEIVPGSTLQLSSSAAQQVGAVGGSSVGAATTASRADHVHGFSYLMPIVSFNAAALAAQQTPNELVLNDLSYRDKLIILNIGGGTATISVKIPTDISTPYPIGTQINIQTHAPVNQSTLAGFVTITPVASGTTTLVCTPVPADQTNNAARLREQYSITTLIKIGNNLWTAVGDLTL
jgi:hypothetical protein